MDQKTCNGPCGETKDVTEEFWYFHKNVTPWLPYAVCKACHLARMATRRAEKREQVLATGIASKRYALYGITRNQFDDLWAAQDGHCANPGCRASFDEAVPHTDHCHVLEHIRGLLCRDCNLALGNAKDNVERLYGLIEYLGMAPAIDASELRNRGKVCEEQGCTRPPVPGRRFCQPCHNLHERSDRVLRKEQQRGQECLRPDCSEPRHEMPSQMSPYCITHHRENRRKKTS